MAPAFPSELSQLLKKVSRSFYLTLRVLPSSIRPQIGLAYLLARLTDTVADTGLVSVPRRLEVLEALRERILGARSAPVQLGELAASQSTPAERQLLERHEHLLALMGGFSAADQELIHRVIATITSGQELDLKRFGGASANQIVPLNNEAELDDYTYRVAGCVGEFWTRMCRSHLFLDEAIDEPTLLSNSVRFGQGLQLVNILRDVPTDLRSGRCYLPTETLTAHQLSPSALLAPANEADFRPLYNRYLDKAYGHLEAGWAYTNALPRRCRRVRLACAWPILIGAKTLQRLRVENVLDPQHRIKISRPEVRRIILRSLLLLPWPNAWKKLFEPRRA